MGKNSAMLNIFFRVMKKDKEAISLVLPKSYVKNVESIDYKYLKDNNYKNLIFDIDNTIMPVNDINVSEELKVFFKKLKKDFNICILSNNDNWRVDPVKEKLGVKGFANAKKPNKYAYDKALELLNSEPSNTVMIGDQMLSDMVFGNKYELYTILVEPYKNKYDIKTGTSRILQNIMMRKLKDKIVRYKYY